MAAGCCNCHVSRVLQSGIMHGDLQLFCFVIYEVNFALKPRLTFKYTNKYFCKRLEGEKYKTAADAATI